MSPQESHRRRVNITQKFPVVVVVVVDDDDDDDDDDQALPTSKTSKDDRAQRERGVIIWLVNFYCARRASFLRGSLRRCHVRPCQPLLRATLISFFFLPLSVTLPPSLSLASPISIRSLFLFLWHRFTYRDKNLPGTLVRDVGLVFLVPFPCSLCQRLTFCAFFVENRVKR